jgi:glycosyltransferase involved in cell wall biosynthesis
LTASQHSDVTWPKISLVTPVFNSVEYIEQTIRSVLAQGYPNLEYFIIDGASSDGTLDIIQKYASQISGYISEPDNGMYDAINKGFAPTSGEIMGWISATDQLQLGALSVVGSVFREHPEVEWITGRPSWSNDAGMILGVKDLPRWSRYRFLAGANKYIQQESTFWRRSLWDRVGAHVDASRRSASDFELWVRFFRHARLYSVDALIGSFRVHSNSDSLSAIDKYNTICEGILEKELKSMQGATLVKLFRALTRGVQHIPKVRVIWNRTAIQALYHFPGPDLPPVIRHQYHRWKTSR